MLSAGRILSKASAALSGAAFDPMSQLFVETSGDPNADRRFAYARDLASRGEVAAAADLLDQTLELAPNFTSAWFALGELALKLGEAGRAVAAFRHSLRADPLDRRGAKLHLIRLGALARESAVPAATALPPEMPPDYVKALFDQFAPRFDATLVEKLDYRAPDLLRAAVARVCENIARPLPFESALDLGCGTGLGARAFCDMTRAMAGVDLSPAMLARAKATGLYTTLSEIDMLAALRSAPGKSCDLLLAADAVIYLADLAPLCAEAARVLAPGGLFAFTVETHDGEGVVLGEKLRYAHAADYLRAVLAAAGLDVACFEPASARHDGGVPVPGLVIVARRP